MAGMQMMNTRLSPQRTLPRTLLNLLDLRLCDDGPEGSPATSMNMRRSSCPPFLSAPVRCFGTFPHVANLPGPQFRTSRTTYVTSLLSTRDFVAAGVYQRRLTTGRSVSSLWSSGSWPRTIETEGALTTGTTRPGGVRRAEPRPSGPDAGGGVFADTAFRSICQSLKESYLKK
jgi:hypothetical protein